jgi:hypothetical protein
MQELRKPMFHIRLVRQQEEKDLCCKASLSLVIRTSSLRRVILKLMLVKDST